MSILRQELRRITENESPDRHPILIEQLRQSHSHSIHTLPSPVPISSYTCGMHALDFVENEEYRGIVLASPNHVFASPRFLQRLIERGVLIQMDKPEAGALIIYSLEGAITHIGKLLSTERVESKWGLGHLYEHGFLEVSCDYGNEIQFFHPLDIDTALDELVDLARDNGVQFQE